MRYVQIPNIKLPVSVLGFGGSALLGRTGRTDSVRALNRAYDAGINIFDTARSYGYGESESLLGDFLKGKRDRVVLSTKFGILPVKTNWLKNTIKPIARRMLELAPSGRRVIRTRVKAQFQEGMFSAQVLRNSLDESLRRLRTDYVDFLFAHSAPFSILENDELMVELEKTVQSGKVRTAGISAAPDVVAQLLEVRPSVLKAFQFPHNMFDGSLLETLPGVDRKESVFIANHPFGGVARVEKCRQALRALSQNKNTPVNLREKMREVNDQVLAEVVLNAIVTGTNIDIVIPAMMKRGHLESNVAAIDSCRFSDTEITWIRANWNEAAALVVSEPVSAIP